ncbi:membrane protein [Youhaiella tibetensis]|uniref:SHOCT domain-containing protein n=1 Tax=Paradevosia tibetensis TaxID=1447062 RepID=A0A5B9DMX1_9HYPH|nr:SHOCT domain-containing protein [Youhaiella tibetensis]AKR54930.1 membrane protein [Devosia sp. H5989]QEE20039.1 SHOCT domain-containing protein [Youhaiella tibetensis]GGF27675.1 membrane protein [Youhaiella tibetensis]
MSFSSSFWEYLWLIVSTFFFIAYLVVLFQIIIDLFRDRSLGGLAKAIWVIFLIVFPLITALVYLIVRGGGMADRQNQQVNEARQEADAYIKRVAGTNAADQIASAKALLDKGTITQAEFEKLKAKALA